jgi:hypothetical protein
MGRLIGYDGAILASQNCGLYGPIVHPRVICVVDHGRMTLTDANFQLVYQSALLACSTVRRSYHARYLWSEWESGRSKLEFSLSAPVGLQEIFTCCKTLHDMGPLALLPIRRKVCCGFLPHLKIHRPGRARTWVL